MDFSKGWFPVSGILRAGPAGGIFQADFAAGGLMAITVSAFCNLFSAKWRLLAMASSLDE